MRLFGTSDSLPHNDVFISYSRADADRAGAIRDAIAADFRKFWPDPLRIFFDTADIRSRQAWKRRSRPALRRSRALLVISSANYLRSEYCRWDSDEFDGPVYFIPLDDHRMERAMPWFRSGVDAARRDIVRRRVRGRDDLFVGRIRELVELRTHLVDSRLIVVHGIGGMGKTELASAYTDVFAGAYPGGRWRVDAFGCADVLVAISRLASELGLGTAEQNPVELGRMVLVRFTRPCLLVLDNVSEPELLTSAAVLTDLPSLHTIVTTRLGRSDLPSGASLGVLEIPPLTVADGAALFRTRDLGEDESARQIVQLLEGYPLAVGQAAVQLSTADISASQLLILLCSRGFGVLVESDRRVSIIVDESLAELPHRARSALGIASLLPPETIPWAWLESLTGVDSGGAWPRIRAMLEGRRLLTVTADPRYARLHPVLAGHIRRREADAQLGRRLDVHLGSETDRLIRSVAPKADDLAVVASSLIVRLADRSNWERRQARLALFAVSLIRPAQERLDSVAVGELATAAVAAYEWLVAVDRCATRYRAGLSWSFVNLGNVLLARGEPGAALDAYERSVEVDEQLIELDPNSRYARQNLAVGLVKVADALVASGEAAAAMRRLERAETVLQGLVDSAPADPRLRRDLAALHAKSGDLLRSSGRLDEARHRFERSLAIIEALVALDSADVGWRRELAGSLDRIGDSLFELGELDAAAERYQRALAIEEELLASDGDNAVLRHDVAVALSKVGRVFARLSEPRIALEWFERSLRAREINAARDDVVRWRADVWVSLIEIGETLSRLGEKVEARARFERALLIAESMVTAVPSTRRNVASSHMVLALLLDDEDDPAAIGHRHAADEIFTVLRAAGTLSPADREWLGRVERRRWRQG